LLNSLEHILGKEEVRDGPPRGSNPLNGSMNVRTFSTLTLLLIIQVRKILILAFSFIDFEGLVIAS